MLSVFLVLGYSKSILQGMRPIPWRFSA